MSEKLYLPSSGTEGAIFFENWCSKCEHDKNLNGTKPDPDDCSDDDYCQIINNSYLGHVPQWIYKDGEPACTEFCPIDAAPKC